MVVIRRSRRVPDDDRNREAEKNAMIAGTYLEDMLNRRRARQLAEAEERARAELIAEMREWDARRLEAEAKGEPFDEPLPDLDE